MSRDKPGNCSCSAESWCPRKYETKSFVAFSLFFISISAKSQKIWRKGVGSCFDSTASEPHGRNVHVFSWLLIQRKCEWILMEKTDLKKWGKIGRICAKREFQSHSTPEWNPERNEFSHIERRGENDSRKLLELHFFFVYSNNIIWSVLLKERSSGSLLQWLL